MTSTAREVAEKILKGCCIAGTSERYPDLLYDLEQGLISFGQERFEAAIDKAADIVHNTEGPNSCGLEQAEEAIRALKQSKEKS